MQPSFTDVIMLLLGSNAISATAVYGIVKLMVLKQPLFGRRDDTGTHHIAE